MPEPTEDDKLTEAPTSAGAHKTLIAPAGWSLEAEDQVGPYTLREKLGEGGFGVVWLADQSKPVKRRVALKLLKPGMDSRQFVARFEAERQALALMDHAGVARVLDAGLSDSGRPYFVMEYVRGLPITEYCAQERSDIEERIRLMIQVCDAVQHAHMKGVIHRDLKPSNILVQLIDRKPAVKVIDFGVAKAINQQLSDSTVYTEQGQMIGTPEYMSPEQARGSVIDIDTRSDVYALGAVLYQLLTGEPPFDSKSLRTGGHAAIQRRIEEEDPPKPSTRVSQVGRSVPSKSISLDPAAHSRRLRGELDWIAMKCLEKDRNRRYDTASAMAADLERYLNNEPVEAGPPSTIYRLRKFTMRNRGLVAAMCIVAASLVLGVAGTTAGMVWAMQQRDRAVLAEQDAMTRSEEAIAARDQSEAVTRFLTDMLAAADPNQLGRDVTVREVIGTAAKGISRDFADQPTVEAKLHQTLAQTYIGLGEYDKAESHVERALTLRTNLLGPDHVDSLESAAQRGLLLYHQGRFEEAEPYVRDLIQRLRETLGESDRLTLLMMEQLGVLLVDHARVEEAESILKEAVELRKAHLGLEHNETLSAINNLAMLYGDIGRFEEAEALYNQIIPLGIKSLGKEHPAVLTARSNLAWLYFLMSRYDEAIELNEELLSTKRRVFGDDHMETLNTINNLAIAYKAIERYDMAEPLYREDLEKTLRLFGETHPNSFVTMSNFAGFLSAQDRCEEAEEWFARVIGLMRTHLPPDHPGLGSTLHRYGQCKLKMQEYGQAEKLLLEAHPIVGGFFGPDHRGTQLLTEDLITLYESMGNESEAARWRAERDAINRRLAEASGADGEPD